MTSTYGIPALVCNLEEYEISELKDLDSIRDKGWKVLVGFFLATYGEGEPTDNAIEFYDWLMGGGNKNPEEDIQDFGDERGCLKHLHYFIFGLGNKTYEHFNAMARRCDKRLSKWGFASNIGELGEGDDDGR